jgi:hypothetical protein
MRCMFGSWIMRSVGAGTLGLLTATGCSSSGKAAPHPTSLKVPSVVSQSGDKALADLQQAGFKVVRFNATPNPTATGQVVSQNPAAGTMLLAHNRVLLTVSAGPHPTATEIFVPGISTCQMDQVPTSQPPCVGGPVLAKIMGR